MHTHASKQLSAAVSARSLNSQASVAAERAVIQPSDGVSAALGRGEVRLTCRPLLRGSTHRDRREQAGVQHRRSTTGVWGGGPVSWTHMVAHERGASFWELNRLKVSYSREHESAQAGGQQTERGMQTPAEQGAPRGARSQDSGIMT